MRHGTEQMSGMLVAVEIMGVDGLSARAHSVRGEEGLWTIVPTAKGS